jgi:hypothetical protein
LKQILKIKLPIPEAGEDKATYNLQKNFDFWKNRTDETQKSNPSDIFQDYEIEYECDKRKKWYCKTRRGIIFG